MASSPTCSVSVGPRPGSAPESAREGVHLLGLPQPVRDLGHASTGARCPAGEGPHVAAGLVRSGPFAFRILLGTRGCPSLVNGCLEPGPGPALPALCLCFWPLLGFHREEPSHAWSCVRILSRTFSRNGVDRDLGVPRGLPCLLWFPSVRSFLLHFSLSRCFLVPLSSLWFSSHVLFSVPRVQLRTDGEQLPSGVPPGSLLPPPALRALVRLPGTCPGPQSGVCRLHLAGVGTRAVC